MVKDHAKGPLNSQIRVSMVGEAGSFKAYALTRSTEFRNKIVTIFSLSFSFWNVIFTVFSLGMVWPLKPSLPTRKYFLC